MIRIRGENGSRGNGRRGRGMERGGYTTFCMNVRISPSLFPSDPVLRCTWVQISPQNLTACTRQELCLSDDTTTRFGFFTIDVDVNGSRRTWCDDGLWPSWNRFRGWGLTAKTVPASRENGSSAKTVPHISCIYGPFSRIDMHPRNQFPIMSCAFGFFFFKTS